METKFTPDGKKVAVCGKINSTEYIVQEVYVTESGDEIPSGENFTAKVLLDEPALSWKDKELAKVERNLQAAKDYYDSQVKKNRQLEQEAKAVSELLKRNNFLKDKLPEFDWDHFCDAVTGNVKYLVRANYTLEITSFEEEHYRYENNYGDRVFDGIRALSVIATGSNYSTKYHLHTYQDSSGGVNEVFYIKDDEELYRVVMNYLDKRFNEDKLSLNDIKTASKYVKVPDEYVSKYKEKRIQELKDSWERNTLQAQESYDKSIKELEDLE